MPDSHNFKLNFLTRSSLFLILIFFCFLFENKAQTPAIVKITDLESLIGSDNDTTYIFNFWATWCKPCVAELPYFEKLNEKISGERTKVLLISLDFKRQLNSQLIPFLKKNKIKSTVLLLDEPDYNSWIDKIDSSWGGAIPATLMINNKFKKRIFFEKEFEYDELLNEYDQFKTYLK